MCARQAEKYIYIFFFYPSLQVEMSDLKTVAKTGMIKLDFNLPLQKVYM